MHGNSPLMFFKDTGLPSNVAQSRDPLETTMHPDLNALNKQTIAIAREYTGEVAWPTVLLVALVWTLLLTDL